MTRNMYRNYINNLRTAYYGGIGRTENGFNWLWKDVVLIEEVEVNSSDLTMTIRVHLNSSKIIGITNPLTPQYKKGRLFKTKRPAQWYFDNPPTELTKMIELKALYVRAWANQ